MFNIVFTVIVTILSAIHSLQAMELTFTPPSLQRKVPSLQKLCRAAIVRNIQEPEELDEFVNGKTRYHLLSDDMRKKIASQLPGRPHQHCRIDSQFPVIKAVFNDALDVCMIWDAKNNISLINTVAGSTVYSFEAPHITDIALSSDGEKYFLQCRDTSLGCKMYGEICYFKRNDTTMINFVRNRIDSCYKGSFSPIGNGLIVQQSAGLLLQDIDSHLKFYDGCQRIQFCSTGQRLLVRKYGITRVIDMHNNQELLQVSNTWQDFINSNGKKLFRQSTDILYGRYGGELYDVDSGAVVSIPLSYQVTCDPFSADGNYLLFSHNNMSELWDARSGNKIVSFDNGAMIPEFVLGGKYLFVKSPGGYGAFILLEDLIAHAAKETNTIIDIKSVHALYDTDSCHDFFLPAKGDYGVVLNGKKDLFLIDGFDKDFVLLSKNQNYWTFSTTGQMIFLDCLSGQDKRYVEILRFDNDLTIEQFLLKQLIIARTMTQQQIESNEYLGGIYASLLPDQKQYFADYVFKPL